jgi:serine/threonine protein kinase
MIQLPAPAYAPGVRIYKYNLVAKLGQGKSGQVWLANDLALQREYAVKILNPGLPVDQRLREAQIGHVLCHNNLVRVHQADVQGYGNDHIVVIAMDYMPDGSVVRLMNPSNFLVLPDVLRVAKDILQGLEYLHANSFYHNDIKPENILIGPAGQAMLSDYGIVGVSSGGQSVAAPGAYRFHMAPEVVTGGNINIQTDIYQTGLTLFRLACGLSHLRSKQSTLGWDDYYQAAHDGKLITKNDFTPFVPTRLQSIILKAIEPDPALRYQSALEMRRAVEKLAFPGHWTVNPSGELIGSSGRNEYRFEKHATGGKRFCLTSYKKSLNSGHQTKVSAFCGRNLTSSQADALSGKFIKHVVTGS